MDSAASIKGKKFRVALMGIYHESNTFIHTPTTLEDFTNGHWLKGEDIRKEYQDAHHEIGGMFEILDFNDIDTVPVMFAEATPGGTVAAETYDTLLHEMLQDLQAHLPVDACLVVPHGAGVTEEHPDMDGHWLSELRKIMGPGIPIMGTLDPHANVSPLMVASTNALIAYKTNPHLDQRETGKAAAELLINTLRQLIQPVQVLTQTAVAISIEQQYTSAQPCKNLYDLAQQLTDQKKILSTSILLGFPYADVKEMGSAFIVVSNNDLSLAYQTGEQLKKTLTDTKKQFVGEKMDIDSLLPRIAKMEKPILLLDMGDNVGGGSPGNSVHLLNALETYGHYPSFICLYDPAAVQQCLKYTAQDTFILSVGNHDAVPEAQVFTGKVRLLAITDGKFQEMNPRHGGQVNYNMGKTAIVSTAAGNVIMINSIRVPPFSLSQITSFGIPPSAFDVIVAKGVNAPVAAYGPVCRTIVQVNTPGVTQADMTLFHFKNRRKPLFPFES